MKKKAGCREKNAKGKPCGMKPLRNSDCCLAHSRKARTKAQAARVKGGQRRGRQQQRAAAAPPTTVAPPKWRDLISIGDVDAAVQFAAIEVIDGRMGAREGAATAKLLQLARAAAEQRQQQQARKRSAKSPRGAVSGAEALALAVETLQELMGQAKNDKGMDPAERRAQAIQAAAALGKLADPQRVISELGAALRQAHADIAELEERVGAPQEPARNPGGPGASAEH